MGRKIEGFWDCQYCDKKGIRGSIRECPTCGKIRDESTKFYLNKDKMHYLSPEEEKHVPKGPDWFCPYCNSYNRCDVDKCENCGHDKDSTDKNYYEVRAEEDAKKRTANRTHYEEPKREPKVETPNNYQNHSDNASDYRNENNYSHHANRTKNILKYGVISALIIAFIALCLFLFVPKESEFSVTDIHWEYGVEVEEYRTLFESGWTMPADGRLQYTQEEIYEYIDVLDHYETRTREVSEQVLDGYDTVVTGYTDLGNGYFEENTTQVPRYRTEYRTETYQEPVYRSEPVYRTKYYYEVDRWVYDRTLTTQGNDKNTYFDDYQPIVNERLGDRSKKYEFYGLVEGESKHMNINEDVWNQYDVGDIIPIKINRAGIITIIERENRGGGFGGQN